MRGVVQVLVERCDGTRYSKECATSDRFPETLYETLAAFLGLHTPYLGLSVRSVHSMLLPWASLPVPWIMLSWTGALVALATFGQPVVTLHLKGIPFKDIPSFLP